MTKYKDEMERATDLYRQPKNTPYESNERTQSFQNSMVTLWTQMAKLFHPQWTKNNGEMGSQTFRDWTTELQRFGSNGVLRGLDAVKCSGSSYVPNLNKFIGFCIESNTGNVRPGDSYSEQEHNGALKPTPNGVPLCWTVGKYDHEQLMKSPCFEDHDLAQQTGGNGWIHESLALI